MRLIGLMVLCFNCALASAAVSCEQLANIAYATEQLRNQGQPLEALLADADRIAATNKFTPADMDQIRAVIAASFRRDRAPYEVLQECRERLPR